MKPSLISTTLIISAFLLGLSGCGRSKTETAMVEWCQAIGGTKKSCSCFGDNISDELSDKEQATLLRLMKDEITLLDEERLGLPLTRIMGISNQILQQCMS